MTEQNTANERITTIEDGEGTVNESLSTGGPGPDGQLDTVVERLSGAQDKPADKPEPESKPESKDDEAEPAKKAAAAKKAPAKKKS